MSNKKPATKRRLLLISFTLLMANSAKAQLGAASLKGPGIAVSADYLPAVHYIRPEDSVKTAATSVRKRYNIGVGFLLSSRIDTATKKVRTWNLNASASYMEFSNKDYEKTIFPEKLLGTQIGLQHYRTLRGRWSLFVAVSAGLYSDMEKIDYDDIFLNGGVLFIKQKNAHFSYGFGVALTNTFGAPMILPAFMMQWKSGNRFKVDINIPEKLSISTALSRADELALALRLNGAAYDVEKSPVKNERLLGYREVTIGLENTWHVTKNLDFTAAGGSVLLGSVDFREKSSSLFNYGNIFKDRPEHRLATGLYLSAGLRMKF
ncbi:MAG TPA: DUF6268 family outer membrane beta-barrel protein [Chitinophaga sp.]|uniref:DUF6268 family outer membrane beta-barrel protein n=1 Tax=Chitinophaga sp. TaxID=1869181 RepID=UPI002C473E8D|nr:DUF6268 family outer membrane beta-barrel protein [Chitinophaga sp.]HVI47164.1 DUF6268 family outer membrane beta-barrel protein [Chitinophaga sp.]